MKNSGKYFWKFADDLDWVVWVVFIIVFIFSIERDQ